MEINLNIIKDDRYYYMLAGDFSGLTKKELEVFDSFFGHIKILLRGLDINEDN